jgi:L-proline amide hydrolase
MAEVSSVEDYAPFRGWRTWYRITGERSSAKPPVFVLHGGPGAAHNYLERYKLLARDGRAVIHYDQLGCGNSTLLPDKGADFWTPALFVDELNNLIDHLRLRKAYHVLGQSWGGMLASEFGITQVAGNRQFAGFHEALGRRSQSAAR